MLNNTFHELFPKAKAIIGMIHLAGEGRPERLRRALEEIRIYAEEGVSGAIVEDYHSDSLDVEEVLKKIHPIEGFTLGINVLNNPYSAFGLADKYGARFVQFDSVMSNRLDFPRYVQQRFVHPSVAVLGGVRFKYQPSTGRTLEEDIAEGIERCDVIVTTGDGTGLETPMPKLRDFRRVMERFPLIVGAGVTAENVREQLAVCDGAIVGSYFKNGSTQAPVDRQRVRDLMSVVNSAN